MNRTPVTITIDELEAHCKIFAGARDELADRLQALRDEQEAAKRRRMQGIKNSVGRFRASYDQLHEALEDGRALFVRPKTRTLHGIRIGVMKRRGKLEIADAQHLVAAIKKLFPDQADTLIKTTEAPVRDALANLPAKDLQRLGVGVSDDREEVFIKSADSELDKLIDALLADDDLEQESQ